MMASICHVSDSATYCCTHQQADCDVAAVHLSKAALSFICPQGELMSRVWNALCTTIWTRRRTPHQYKRLQPSTAWANSSSIYSDHYSKNPSTTAANDIFHYASVGGGHRIPNGCDTSGKHFPDTHNSVTSYQDFAADVPVFDCFSWLTLPTQVNAAQWWWWGQESGSALRYCTLTPFDRVLSQCAKYRGVSNEIPWKLQCKIKGGLICFQNKK